MNQLIFASLSHTHYWYEVGMLKVPGVLDLLVVLRSRMNGIGSLGLIVLCATSCGGHSIVTGIGGTLESYHIDSPVLHQEASLQKICALEKNQAANKLIISSCTPNQATILLLKKNLNASKPSGHTPSGGKNV